MFPFRRFLTVRVHEQLDPSLNEGDERTYTYAVEMQPGDDLRSLIGKCSRKIIASIE